MMNDLLNFAVDVAKENWDVIAVMIGLPALAIAGLGVAEVINKVKGVFR
ncbi:hypothetical protein ACTUM7_01265 [Basfia succiniciproducens]